MGCRNFGEVESETLSTEQSRIRKEKTKSKEKEVGTILQRPISVCKQLFQKPRSAQKEQLETHLRKTYSNPNREIPLSEPAVWPAAPGVEFNNKPTSLKEINAVVQKAGAKSAPGPNGMFYLLNKKCSKVHERLHKILRGIWRNLRISEQWMSADGVYISKEQNATEINQFRPISLFNVEGNIVFSVMAFYLTKYLTENGYINTPEFWMFRTCKDDLGSY